ERQVARPAPAAPAQAPGLLAFGGASPIGPAPRSFAAAHNDAERKDAGVKSASDALKESLASHGYPDQVKDALTRTIEDQADPYVGWMKVFVEQAKRSGGASPQIRFEVDERSARAAISRTGALSSRERELLAKHFTGLAPLDASQARTRAETWNVQDSGSGM